MKRYQASTHLKAAGALTFGTVYPVDRTMPLSTRVFRTTLNWLDANRIRMTFSFVFGPAALTFLATLRRRRTNSRYLNTLFRRCCGNPDGRLYELRRSDRARLLRFGDELGVRAGCDVFFSRAERRRARSRCL
jgi:hypothetical protein